MKNNLNKLLIIICTFALIISFTSEKEAKAASSCFYVDGTKICDANGNMFIIRGINIPYAWYTSYGETMIQAAAKAGANSVRVVISDGEKYAKTSSAELQKIISWCKDNKLICILEIHDATGNDDTSSLKNAANYWIDMKDILSANEKYVIINIANEWYGTWDGRAWANGYKNAIQDIRNAGIKNMLMVDCAGWGQYPDSIKDYGRSVYKADSLMNTVFSIHMYEYSGGSASAVKTNIDNALNIGVPVVIGEFGPKHTNGDVDEATIMSYCTLKNVGYIGWSWYGNSSDWEYLDISNDYYGLSYTDWGNTLIYDTYGLANTSSICSVFGSLSSDACN